MIQVKLNMRLNIPIDAEFIMISFRINNILSKGNAYDSILKESKKLSVNKYLITNQFDY